MREVGCELASPKPLTQCGLAPSPGGQVLLLTVLVLSVTIVATLTVAGILTVVHIREASDVSHSMAALYAADAGIEYELYHRRKDPVALKPVFLNGADVNTLVLPLSIRSVGKSGNVARAFEYTPK